MLGNRETLKPRRAQHSAPCGWTQPAAEQHNVAGTSRASAAVQETASVWRRRFERKIDVYIGRRRSHLPVLHNVEGDQSLTFFFSRVFSGNCSLGPAMEVSSYWKAMQLPVLDRKHTYGGAIEGVHLSG